MHLVGFSWLFEESFYENYQRIATSNKRVDRKKNARKRVNSIEIIFCNKFYLNDKTREC